MSRCLRVVAAGRLECVPLTRHIVAQALAGLPAEVVDNAVLCASELVTNAVRHSASGQPGQVFQLAVDIDDAWLCIQVTDQGGPTEPVLLPAPEECTGHRGLPLITRLGVLHVAGDCTGRSVSAWLPLRDCFEVNT